MLAYYIRGLSRLCLHIMVMTVVVAFDSIAHLLVLRPLLGKAKQCEHT